MNTEGRSSTDAIARAWDREYSAGRYEDEPPVPLVRDILAAARDAGVLHETALYIGCGNGRNYLPLVEGGLDLVGLDISAAAIARPAERAPDRRHRLVVGDLRSLRAGAVFGVVVGIQVFQHGDRRTAHAHVRAAKERVAPGGLMAVRVNAAGTDIAFAHELLEGDEARGFTVRYSQGPKTGLEIHFFCEEELRELFAEFDPALSLRRSVTRREPPQRGQWTQWEAIWRRES